VTPVHRRRLGPERSQVQDLQLAVGDRVVCDHNAIAQLGVANGSRGAITALDRALGSEPREQAQRAACWQARTAINRAYAEQRTSEHSRDQQPTVPQRPPIDRRQPDPASTRSIRARGRSGPERAAGWQHHEGGPPADVEPWP
jgi:hypothetical protein